MKRGASSVAIAWRMSWAASLSKTATDGSLTLTTLPTRGRKLTIGSRPWLATLSRRRSPRLASHATESSGG
ncbi:MAG: hypothetical protein ACK53L_05435, partial [Pirellulaceae bacterium]